MALLSRRCSLASCVVFCLLGLSAANAGRRLQQGNAPGSGALSEAPINCGIGCARDKPRLVCGVDNVTYAHRCLAMCQGVSVQAQGACVKADADLLDTSGDLPNITIEVMTRFRKNGFNYVGKGKGDPSNRPIDSLIETNDTNGRLPAISYDPRFERAVRFVYDTKDLYIAKQVIGPSPVSSPTAVGSPSPTSPRRTSSPPSIAGAMPAPSDGSTAAAGDVSSADPVAADLQLPEEQVLDNATSPGARRLNYVIGTDDRRQITTTTIFPWRTVGLLTGYDGTQTRPCTGTMLDPTSVLTVAHCVHGGAGRSFFTTIRFTPGQNGGSAPYGVDAPDANLNWVTIYYAWTSSTNWGFDMAVVQLRYSYHNLIGYTYMKVVSSDTYGARTMNTAGYPTVKGYGSMWYTTCTMTDLEPRDNITSTACDITWGQSGSALYEYVPTNADRLVRGIVSYTTCASSCGCCATSWRNYAHQMTWIRSRDANNWAAAR